LIEHRTSFDDATMYELRRPAAGLSRFIEHYWFVTSTPQAPVDLRVEVFVDGRADLIFNFGASYVRQVIGGEARKISRSNLDAQRLHPIRIAQRGIVRTTGVRFRLGGVGPFARAPLHTFTNATVPPQAALGSEARALEGTLRDTADLDEQARCLVAAAWKKILAWPMQTLMTYHDPVTHAVTSDPRAALEAAVREAKQL
jgi:hypothetical protein